MMHKCDDDAWENTINNGHKLLGKYNHHSFIYNIEHFMHLYKKSLIKKLVQEEPCIQEGLTRFRKANNIDFYAVNEIMRVTEPCIETRDNPFKFKYLIPSNVDYNKECEGYDMVCFNDVDIVENYKEEVKKLKAYLDTIYPEKSSFEI